MKGHEGIDTNPKIGTPTPIYAVFDGNCYVTTNGPYGIRLKLYDDLGLQASYCHLSSVKIKRGQRVKAGDLLGYSGDTTTAANPNMPVHLHFMIKQCDPKTGAVYSKGNGYFGSIPIHFDKKQNKLYIDTIKDYKFAPTFVQKPIIQVAPTPSKDDEELKVSLNNAIEEIKTASKEKAILEGKIANASELIKEVQKTLEVTKN